MNILVTGGNGFIGSNFIDSALQSNFADHITNVDVMTDVSSDWIDQKYKKDDRYHKFDLNICDLPTFGGKMSIFDICIHFAAESHVDNSINDVSPFLKTNINGTLAVAEYCTKRGITMFHISTDEVYGHLENLDEAKFDVEDPLNPRNPYAASKACAELMLKAYENTAPSFIYYVIRPSNNYGYRQDPTKFLPKLINSLYSGNSFPMYGKGDFYREWTWVLDTCAAIMRIVDSESKFRDSGTAFNISSNEIISNFDLAMKVTEKMREFKPDTVANISFVKDPRGNAHDRIYSIENSIGLVYKDIDDGIYMLLEEFFESDNSAG